MWKFPSISSKHPDVLWNPENMKGEVISDHVLMLWWKINCRSFSEYEKETLGFRTICLNRWERVWSPIQDLVLKISLFTHSLKQHKTKADSKISCPNFGVVWICFRKQNTPKQMCFYFEIHLEVKSWRYWKNGIVDLVKQYQLTNLA